VGYEAEVISVGTSKQAASPAIRLPKTGKLGTHLFFIMVISHPWWVARRR